MCQSFAMPSETARNALTVKGCYGLEYGTEMLKQYNDSKGHKDGAISARMAEHAKERGTVVRIWLYLT